MIIDRIRDFKEFKNLYESRPMQTDLFTLDHIINNPHLYCFYGESDSKLKGFIFITRDKKGRLFLNGVSVPKNMSDNKDAIIKICDGYRQDIYSDTDLKHAIYMLKQSGFKHYKGITYLRRYKNVKR